MHNKGQIDLASLQVTASEQEAKTFMLKRMGRIKDSLARFLLNRFDEHGPDPLSQLKSEAKKQGLPYLHVAFLCRYFVDQFGKEGLSLLSNVLREGVVKEVVETREILKVKAKDAIAAVRVLSYIHSCGGVRGEITEATPIRAVRTEWFCPVKDKLNREWGENAVSLPIIEFMAKCINPNIVVSHPKYLCGGDDRCEIVFELRNEEKVAIL